MKTYGVLLAGLLLATGATADEATTQNSDAYTLATAETTQAIDWEAEQDLAKQNELKVLDIDVTDQVDEIGDKVSAKINEKFNQQLKKDLAL